MLTAHQRLVAFLQQNGLSTARAEATVGAFEREIREQVAREIEAESEKTADEDNDPGAKARSFGLYIAARTARNGTKDA